MSPADTAKLDEAHRFLELKLGTIAWLGPHPGVKQVQIEIDDLDDGDGGLGFWVINGAWRGTLYRADDGTLSIVDERGVLHEPVYLVEICPQRVVVPVLRTEGDEDEDIPF